jgi:hypothetical protein
MTVDYLGGNANLTQVRNPFSYEKIEQISRDIQTSWLTLDEITNQINNWGDESQDGYLTDLEVAVRMAIEDYLGMAIFPIQYRVYYGNFGQSGTTVSLDIPEASAGTTGITVNLVQYYNASVPSVLTTISSSTYQYDPSGNKLILNSVPNDISNQISNPFVVTYTNNASFIAQYPVVKQAGLLLLTHLYNNRSNTSEMKLKNIPYGVDALLRPYKKLVM